MRLNWARTRTFFVAVVSLAVSWPVQFLRAVWDTPFGNGNAVAAVTVPFVLGCAGIVGTVLAGRRRLWGCLGGGAVSPRLRFWLSVLSIAGWTVGVAAFTLWTLTWCLVTGSYIESDEGCYEAGSGRVPWRLYVNIALANLCLGTIMRWRWWAAAGASSAITCALTGTLLMRLTGAAAQNMLSMAFVVLVIPIVTAYAAERADRHQYLLKLVHIDQREQTLAWQNQFHEAQLQARTAERAILRRTLGFLLHECGNVLHGLQSVVDTWEVPAPGADLEPTPALAPRLQARGTPRGAAAANAALGDAVKLAPLSTRPGVPPVGLDAEIAEAMRADADGSDGEAEAGETVRIARGDVRILALGVTSLRQLCSDGLDSQKLAAGRLRVHQTRQQVVHLARTVVRSYRLTSTVPIRLEVVTAVERAISEVGAAAGSRAQDPGARAKSASLGESDPEVASSTGSVDADAPALPEVWIDAHRARQILANGITNAVKMCERGSITVRVGLRYRYRHGGAGGGEVESKAGPPGVVEPPTPQSISSSSVAGANPSQTDEVDVMFSVEDTGPGLRGATPESLFEDYTQSSDMRIAAKGSGLGLPLARRLVRLMGGSIGLEEDRERGVTRFWFSVPGEAPRAGGRTAKAMRAAEKRLAASQAEQPRPPSETDPGTPARRTPAPLRAAKRALSVSIDSPNGTARGHWGGGGAGGGGLRSWPVTPATPNPPDLPVVWSDEVASDAPVDARAKTGLGLHLALCDDEPLNLKIAARMLRQLACTYDTYQDGDELPQVRDGRLSGVFSGKSTDRVPARPYDALLLDSVMTRTVGPDVARALRDNGLVAPIFAVTSNVAVHDLHQYKKAGMTAVLPKPFTTAALRIMLLTYVPGRA